MDTQDEELNERAQQARQSLNSATTQGQSKRTESQELEQALDAVRVLFGQPNRTKSPVELELVFFDIRQLFGQPNRT